MKKLAYPLFVIGLVFSLSCNKEDNAAPEDSPEPVKSVRWNVGVTHQLAFSYAADGSLASYTSGSSNLSQQYTYSLSYKNQRLDYIKGNTADSTHYYYDSQNRAIRLSHFSNGVETSRVNYAYQGGKVSEVEWLVSISGNFTPSFKSWFTYNGGEIAQTITDNYDQSGNITETITRNIESYSPELVIEPYSLLHPLYQHQARELFDVVVLAQMRKLPVKISETGRISTGPATYEYEYEITQKRLDSVRCKISLTGAMPYYTAEAVFEY